MANYICAVRTNYFHVKDEEEFRNFAKKLYSNDNDLEVWEEKDKEGKTVFGFGCCSELSGIHADSENGDIEDSIEGDEGAYDRFVDEIQKLVAEDDAVIIYEIGREKLCYLNGLATVITAKEQKYLDISDFAVEQARKMLGNKEWETNSNY